MGLVVYFEAGRQASWDGPVKPQMDGAWWYGATVHKAHACGAVATFARPEAAAPPCLSQTAGGHPALLHRNHTRMTPTVSCCFTRIQHHEPTLHTCDLPQRPLALAIPCIPPAKRAIPSLLLQPHC